MKTLKLILSPELENETDLVILNMATAYELGYIDLPEALRALGEYLKDGTITVFKNKEAV